MDFVYLCIIFEYLLFGSITYFFVKIIWLQFRTTDWLGMNLRGKMITSVFASRGNNMRWGEFPCNAWFFSYQAVDMNCLQNDAYTEAFNFCPWDFDLHAVMQFWSPFENCFTGQVVGVSFAPINFCIFFGWRPWYYGTASGSAKDILILIDISTTMERTYGTSGDSKLKVAIMAAMTIVETLTPNDRVWILTILLMIYKTEL